ncbi:MAG TPA: DinB family protein [Blastocatellia bacterium]|nr:DinB family protein [Blastocatellia bacterium]
MLLMLQDLIYHKGYTNASLLKAIRRHEAAVQDLEMLKTLHHIILANRFWLLLILGLPFSVEEESQVPKSLETLVAQYRETHAQEMAWVSQVQEPELTRIVETPFIPGHTYSVAQALIQVCMHSHGHRAQCSSRLRLLGGTPPNMDFILWLKERPAPDWE